MLASGSPRRKMLLSDAGFRVRVHPVDVDESFDRSLPLPEVPTFLSRKKADAAMPFARVGEIVLAADSIVTIKGEILGKPTDRADAVRMLRQLSGKPHEVLTGCTMRGGGWEETFLTRTWVHLDPLDDAEIDYYIDVFDPLDKAGAYGIQDWIGWCKVRQIEGSYTSVMGLPVAEVYQVLRDWPA